ncbi:MAG: hypothetical protein M1834_005993 [Cirrosporium novae-zelandiae]|nr:MAG: hypothetical protein M1834_005993 [Cirrosporium novae-zelandiae]
MEAATDPKPLCQNTDTDPLSKDESAPVLTTPEPPSSPQRPRNLTDRILEFLSTASNEKLGLCALGLGATTYVVLGRVGLILIGVVGGIILHATWDGSIAAAGHNEARAQEARRRKEVGIDVVSRILAWREEKKEKAGDENTIDLEFSDFQPATRDALVSLVDAVIGNYVKWWYNPVIPSDSSFPAACRETLTGFILSIASHLARKRPADAFLDFVTNTSSILIVFLNELSVALMNPQADGLSHKEAMELYLKEKPESSLANVLDPRQQYRKLDLVSDDVLHNFLGPSNYSCRPAQVFLRRILADVILEKTVQSCSKAEWVNNWIVYLLEDGDREHKLINAIDAGVGGAAASELKAQAAPIQDNSNKPPAQGTQGHQRMMSKADIAMEQAMLEAKRLNEMIAAEDAKRSLEQIRESDLGTVPESVVSSSTTATTEGMATPTSSQSEREHSRRGTGDSSSDHSRSAEIVPDDLETKPWMASAPEDSNVTPLTSQAPSVSKRRSTQSQAYTSAPLTLHKAKVSLLDDSDPNSKSTLKSRPTGDYLLQIEPASSQYTGWMIPRKYVDFEGLHETLRRISVISGVPEFTQEHSTLPHWKGQTKYSLQTNLEQYLSDALKYDRLAESEGMKKFLEKERGLGKAKHGSRFPGPAVFETMGKGALDFLTSAPKGVAEGGKSILDGVTGVFGGPKKTASTTSLPSPPILSKSAAASSLSLPRSEDRDAGESDLRRKSQESTTSSRVSNDDSRLTRTKSQSISKGGPMTPIQTPLASPRSPESGSGMESPSSGLQRSQSSRSMTTKPAQYNDDSAPLTSIEEALNLPPLPCDIADDYGSPTRPIQPKRPINRSSISQVILPSTAPQHSSTTSVSRPPPPLRPQSTQSLKPNRPRPTDPPISSQETQVLVELLFAVLSELYNLSSAWNIRRTLLSAAKTFLLRPGNAGLDAIKDAVQSSLIEANTSDTGIASHINKLRENGMPTEEELKNWPPDPTEEDNEKLRIKARKLLVTKGMPTALNSVMGQAASAEALGRVFDCLQIERVARGLVFAVLLQAMRAITH